MMKNKHSVTHILLGVFIVICIASGCNSRGNATTIKAEENFAIDELTLLERLYDDTDQDGEEESVELYTSAEIAPDGQIGWDTGHRWVLLVRKGNQVFPLFDNRVQYGEVQFWIAYLNKDKVESPESTDLQRQIYATVTDNVAFQLLSYNWDMKSMCYKGEIALNPSDQWGIKHSNKYNMPDPAKIL